MNILEFIEKYFSLDLNGHPLSCEECQYDKFFYTNCPACNMKAWSDAIVTYLIFLNYIEQR